jgi:hypothetical protein
VLCPSAVILQLLAASSAPHCQTCCWCLCWKQQPPAEPSSHPTFEGDSRYASFTPAPAPVRLPSFYPTTTSNCSEPDGCLHCTTAGTDSDISPHLISSSKLATQAPRPRSWLRQLEPAHCPCHSPIVNHSLHSRLFRKEWAFVCPSTFIMPSFLSNLRRISQSTIKSKRSSSSEDSRRANRSSTTLGDNSSDTTTPPSTLAEQDVTALSGASEQTVTSRRSIVNGNGANRYSVMSNVRPFEPTSPRRQLTLSLQGTVSAPPSRMASNNGLPLSPLAPHITSISDGAHVRIFPN